MFVCVFAFVCLNLLWCVSWFISGFALCCCLFLFVCFACVDVFPGLRFVCDVFVILCSFGLACVWCCCVWLFRELLCLFVALVCLVVWCWIVCLFVFLCLVFVVVCFVLRVVVVLLV